MDTNKKVACGEINWHGEANCKVCVVRGSGLFSGLPDAELENLLKPADKFSIGSKVNLYTQGDAAEHVYFIRDGLVKLSQKASGSKQRILRFLGPGSVGGLECLTGSQYHHTAESLTPTEICRIPKETLQDINSRDVHLFGQLMKCWQKGVDDADGVISRLCTGMAHGRVARFLLYTLCEPDGNTCIALSRDDLSALLGVTVETASRVVAEFKRKGILKESRGWFNFDRAGLAEFSSL